ncbi:hypothetical protein [Parabacteroides distasonis]|nr:hypothetical protein [Parabacteroides distasonis]
MIEEFLSRLASGTSSELKDIVISDKVKELVGILYLQQAMRIGKRTKLII